MLVVWSLISFEALLISYLQLSPTQKSCLQEAHPGINYYHLSHCYTMMSHTVYYSPNSVLAQLADLSLSLAFQHPYLGNFCEWHTLLHK